MKSQSIENKLDKETKSFVQEMQASYGIKNSVKNYNDFLDDKMLIINAIRSGIPYSFFEVIQEYSPFSESDWATFLDISTKSLQRYKISQDHLFKSIHTEKIIEMAEVTKLGLDVFGDMNKFKLWLNTPCFALGSEKPINFLQDSYGKEMIMAELTRINYGILG